MANRFSQGLYDYLTGKSARNIGSNADEFVSKVSNPRKLQQLYDYMQSHGAKNIGANADEFYSLMTKADEEPSRKELRQQRREQRREMADSVQQNQQALNPRAGSTAPQNARDIYSRAAQDTREGMKRDELRQMEADRLRDSGLKDAAEQELEDVRQQNRDYRRNRRELMHESMRQAPGYSGMMPGAREQQQPDRITGYNAVTAELAAKEQERQEELDGMKEQYLKAKGDFDANKLRQENLKNAVDIMEQVESGKADLVNGIIDQASRVSNWDYGVSNLLNAAEYTRLREKYESGEELTDAEQKALDAVALSTEMERIAGEVLGNGYQIGRGLSQSASFMLQMASNPARGLGEQLAHKTARRMLRKYGSLESIQKFGKDLIRKKVLTKAAATRVLGDAAEMGILTSTIGAANVAADTMDRLNGDVKTYVDENGFVQYDGVERQADEARLSGFQLFGKAWLSNYIENWTEAFGEYLPSWKQWKSIFKNGLWKMVDETRKKGIKVGKLDAFQRDLAGNPDKLSKWLSQARKAVKLNGLAGEVIEEELGIVLNAAFVGDNEMSDLKDLDQQIQIIASCAIMTGGFKAAELGSNIRAQRQYDKDIKKADETGRALFGAEAWESEKGHIESLDADQAVEYLQTMMRDDTLTTDQKRALTTYTAELMSYQTFNRATDIAMVGRLSKDRQDIIDAYNAGRNLRQASGVRKLYQELDAARAEVGGELARQISRLADEGKPVTKLEGFEGFSKADIDACEKLMILETMARGLNDGTQDRTDDATALLARDLDPVTRVIDGREIVTTAVFTSGTQQTPVYVLDINRDTNMATVIDAEGNKKPVSAKSLSEIQDTPRAFLESAYRERYLSDEQQRQDWQSRHNERTQMPEAGMTLFAGDGSTLLVADVDSYNGEVTVVEGEYDPETNALVPKKGMQPYVIPVSSALALQDQHYDRLDAEKNGTGAEPVAPETPQGNTDTNEQPGQQPAVETGQKIEGPNTEAAPAEPAAPAVEATDFTQVSDADLDYTIKAIQKDVDKLQKEIAKPIDLRDQKAKDKRAKAQQDLAGHMQVLQEWQAEQDRRGAAAAEAARVQAEQEAASKAEAARVEQMSRSAAEVPYKEVIDTLSAMEPEMSFEDYVRFTLRGAKIVWNSNGIKKGLKDLMIATGTNANADRGKYISWLANEDNGGKYLADVIHDIYNGMPEQMLEAGYSDVDVRDIVMDALQSFNSPSALMRGLYSDLVARHNQAQLEYEQRTKDEFAREQGFDNYEDYSTFNEIIKSGEYFEGTHTDDEINEIYSIIAQEYESGTEGSTGTGVQGVVSGAAGQEGGSYGSNQMGSQEEAAEQRGGSDEGRPAQRSNNVVAGSAEAGATVASEVELNGQLYNIADLEQLFKSDIETALSDNGIDAEVVGVRLIGSRIDGSPRTDSDLDLLVEYKGDIAEDALFNMLNADDLEINGVRLDINPIKEGKSGNTEQSQKRTTEDKKEGESGRYTLNDSQKNELRKLAKQYPLASIDDLLTFTGRAFDRKSIAKENSEFVEELRKIQGDFFEQQKKRINKTPQPNALAAAIASGDKAAQDKWNSDFDKVMGRMIPDDIHMLSHTIDVLKKKRKESDDANLKAALDIAIKKINSRIKELKKQAPESVSKDSRVRDFGSGITSYKTKNNLNEVFLNGKETGITFYDNKIYITSKNNSSLKNAANKYGYKYESGMRSLSYSGQVVIDFSDDTLEDALKKAVEIFKEVTPDYSSWPMVAIVNGTEVRYLAAGEYYGEDGMQGLAHGIKNNDAAAIKEAARRMSKLIPSHSYIIPMPSRTGKPSDGVMSLCEEICKIKTTLSIKDILRGKERGSIYEAKKNGQKVDLESLKMTETSSGSTIREVQGKVYIIDNVIASGSTAAAAINAIGGGRPVVVTLAVDSKAMNENARLSVSGTQETQNTLFPERDFNTEGLTREQINALDAFQIARWARANRVLGEELKDAEHLRRILGSYGFLGDDVEVLDSREAGIAKLRELGDEKNAKWLEEHPENKLNGFYLKGKVYLAFSEGDNVLSYFRTLSHEGTHAQNSEDKTGINAILEAVNNGTVTEEELHDIIREVDGAEDANRDFYADKTGEELADELLAHVQEAMTLGLMTEDITDNVTLRTILDNYGTEQGKESADKWRKQRDLLNDFGAQLSGRFGRKAAEGGRNGISGSSQRSGEKAGRRAGTADRSGRLGNSGLVKYTLSDKTAQNGERFYQDEDGNIDLVDIPQAVFNKIGYTKAPLRLIPSMLKHVMFNHKEIKADDQQEAIAFIIGVMRDFDHVRLGRDGALIFSVENGRKTGKLAITVLLNSNNGEYYGLVTSGYEGVDRLEKRPLLWEGSANDTPSTDAATANVTSRDAQGNSEQSGGASNQSKNPEVYTRPAVEPGTDTDSSGVDSGNSNGVTAPTGNSPQTSADKDTKESDTQNNNAKLSVTQRTDKEKQELFDAAKNKFGTTTDFREAGYLLPDGSLLDFSEKNDGGQPGTRNIDHRAVSGIMGGDYETRTDAMLDFVHSGAIRLMPEAASINLANMPTAKQISMLRRFVSKNDGEVILEIDDQNGNSDVYAEYMERTSPTRVINDIKGYFENGVRPTGNVHFSVSVSRSDPFYSNAAKAVEGIQQNKATADQWLAMLQKNGGLKAGEDKWLGLSDWLRQQGAMAAIGERDKAITKDEIEKFIAENAIRIEETRYAEYPESTTNLQDEVLMLWRNSNGNNYDKAEQVQKQLAEKYGDSFNDAVEIWYNGSIRVKDQAAYDRIFNKDGVATANSTRLGYTSEGLDNKREIALTVPTVEPYNATDNVHFGDAGEGRAIAWARFGETELVSENGNGDTKLLKEYEDAKIESDAYEKQLHDKYGIPYDNSMESFEKFVMSMTEEENAEWNRLSDAEIEAERKSVDVKRKKVLVIDEIQSKRHQDGREMGYDTDKDNARSKFAAAIKAVENYRQSLFDKYNANELDLHQYITKEEKQHYEELIAEANMASQFDNSLDPLNIVPDAPFRKNWHELAMKRMLRLAAEEGYDKVAWTSGRQQSDRYNLGKVLDKVTKDSYDTGDDHTMFVMDFTNEMQETLIVDNATGNITSGLGKGHTLSELVGKSVAEQMMALPEDKPSSVGSFAIGGEGMKSFYDQILPSFMNKYGKKWGVKVEDIELPDVENGKYTFHSVDVTPEMKESVMQEGQAMFSINGGKQKGNSYICADGERIDFQPLLFSDSEWNGTVDKNVDAGSSGVQRKRVSGGNTPVGLKLRTLQPGEFCSVERRYTENNHYSFTSGKNKVKTYEDVAYIFKSLQDSAVEHAFAVLVKDGKPTIFHLSIGGFASAPVDFRTIIPAVNDINPDEIFMVHNHPSGGIMPSRADTELLYSFHKAFGADKVMDGVIIDSFNGTFSTFGSNTVKREMPETTQGERKVNVYSFDKQVYIKNNPTASIRTSKDIAEFVTTERLGIREKIGALVISQNGFVFGNIYLPYNSLDGNADAIAKELSDTVVRMGGTAAVLYGNNLDIKNAAKVGNIMQKQDVRLLDAVDITNEVSGFPYYRYTSAADKGLMEANPVYQKLVKADISEAENEEETVRFRIVTDQKLLERLDGSKTVKVYRAMAVDEHGNLIPPMAGKGLASNGRKAETSKSALRKWEQSDENLNVADWTDGDEYAHIQIKDDAGENTRVAYNPYIHTSLQMLNDQFAKAWRRPNMVVVECEVPVWEADVEPEKAYKAKGAKNHVGRTTWTDGPVSRTLNTSPREVILTRYAKPVRIVPMDEYAASVKQLLENNGVLENGIPFSNVTPEQRDALYAAGVPITEPIGSGRNAKSIAAYNEWKGEHPTDPTGTDDDIYAMAREAKEARNDIRFRISMPEGRKEGEEVIDYKTRVYEHFNNSYNPLAPSYVVPDSMKKDEFGKMTGFTGSDLDALYDIIVEFRESEMDGAVHISGPNTIVYRVTGKEPYIRRMYASGFFHENFHAYVDVLRRDPNMGKARFDRLLENMARAAEKYLRQVKGDEKTDNFVKDIHSYYSSEDWNEETIAYAIGDATAFDRVDMLKKYCSEYSNTILDDYLNKIGYEIQSKNGAAPLRDSAVADDRRGQEAGRRGETSEAGQVEESDGIRFSVNVTPAGIKAEYDNLVDGHRITEVMQDYAVSIRSLQEAIAKNSGPVRDWENAYKAENKLTSVNRYMMDEYEDVFLNPMNEAHRKLVMEVVRELRRRNKALSKEDARNKAIEMVDRYLIAKHGLERNEVFARRDAEKEYDAYIKLNPNGTKTVADFYNENRDRDYSGLTTLFNEQKVSDAEAMASAFVGSFESKYKTKELWDKINMATSRQLAISEDGGMISAATRQNIEDMFSYYIPLRGFKEDISEDMYDYMGEGTTPFSPAVKTAKGRSSLADSPIATIANMGMSTILQANRNKVKLTMLRLAENHHTPLISVSQMAYHKNDAGVWEEFLPNIPASATESQAEQIMRQFRANLAQLLLTDPDNYKLAGDLAGIPYKVVSPNQKRQHEVYVVRDGIKYILTVNGNPKAAQAINGQLNPETNKAALVKMTNWVNRNLAANFTTRNPAFVMSNLTRDAIYSNSMVWIKESPRYAANYTKNWALTSYQMIGLLHRANTHTLNLNDETDRLFDEFLRHGGETGYSNLESVEDFKGKMEKRLAAMQRAGVIRGAGDVLEALGDGLDNFNRWAELISRFACYRTSRHAGRSISRSVDDAKEVTVNFNTKGAGAIAAGEWKKGNRLNYIAAEVSQIGRGVYVFWNAGVQGMTNLGKAAMQHKLKAGAMMAFWMGVGYVIAMLMSNGDDDDKKKNKYYNLPKYVRRNNLCFRVGEKWVTIPLAIEIRAMYGMGELAYSSLSGMEYYSAKDLSRDIVSQMTQIMPIDMMEGGGGINALVPSSIKPIWELHENVDWTGMPIYKDSPYNKNEPKWQKAYSSANTQLVSLSRWLNENTGGSDHRSGWIDVNPATLEHLVEGYLGGVGTMATQTMKSVETIAGRREFEWRNTPVASRFIKGGDERTEAKNYRNAYFEYKDEMQKVVDEYNGYRRDMHDTERTDEEQDYASRKLDEIVESPEYQFYLFEWSPLYKKIQNARDTGDKELEDETTRKIVEAYRSFRMSQRRRR